MIEVRGGCSVTGYSNILVENHTTLALGDTNDDQRPAANSSSNEKDL